MSTRAFTDRKGDGWKVWKTIPQDPRGCLPAYARGWLTFEHDTSGDRRRLAPVPDDWELVPTDRLLLWCRVAEPVVRGAGARHSPPRGLPALPDDDDAPARELPG